MLGPLTNPTTTEDESPLRRGFSTNASDGWVYFLVAPEMGLIKIGFSTNPEKRINKQIHESVATLICIGHYMAPGTAERHLHRHFRQYRIKGEWFRDCEEIRSVLGELCAKAAGDWFPGLAPL